MSTARQGQFAFRNVAPGSYLLIAQAGPESDTGGTSTTSWAKADVTVDGEDLTDLVVSLQPTISLAGRMVFEGAAHEPAEPRSLRAPVVFFSGSVSMQGLTVDLRDDRFWIRGIVPGPYTLQSELPGTRHPMGRWWLKSVVANNRDLLDSPIEIRQDVDDAVATFTVTPSALSGRAVYQDGTAAPSVWVIAFSTDPHHWFFHSRRVAGVRTDPRGGYIFKNPPAGDHQLATTTEVDELEWYDQEILERLAPTAMRVRLAEGETRTTPDLQLPTGREPR